MGLDDVLALLYLGSREDIDIRAVTVVGDGLTRCTVGARNARAILALTGHREVPVACGGAAPLLGSNAFPEEWRDAADGLYGLALPEPGDPGGEVSAPDLLARALDGGSALLTLGPLTNVASALRRDPTLAERVPSVVAMAGAIDVPGNAPNQVAEYNVWIDPLAAKEVFGELAVTLVPLDATDAAPVTPFFVDALGTLRSSPIVDTVRDLIADDPFLVGGTYFFWDPLAAALFTDPMLGTYGSRRLLVTASQDAGAGWIVGSDLGDRVRVTTSVRPLAFERTFLSTIGEADVADVRPAPDLDVSFGDEGCRLVSTGDLARGPAIVVFRNRTSRTAILVLASYQRRSAYRDLLAFIGEPGSLVRGAPEGLRPLGTVPASPGADAWATITLAGPFMAAACAIPTTRDNAARAWPGGWLRVRSGHGHG